MADQVIHLKFEWPRGEATYSLTPAQALKAAVLLRHLGLGLSFKKGEVMRTSCTAKFVAAEIVLTRDVLRLRRW